MYVGEVKNKSTVVEVCSRAMDAKRNVSDYKPAGCGRVYVDFGKMRKNSSAYSTITLMLGEMIPGSCTSHPLLYVGYDSGTGKEWAQGEAIANAFRAAGFHAYPPLGTYCDDD